MFGEKGQHKARPTPDLKQRFGLRKESVDGVLDEPVAIAKPEARRFEPGQFVMELLVEILIGIRAVRCQNMIPVLKGRCKAAM